MSTIGSYKNTAFSEGQKFLVLDPETGSTSLVRGSSLVSYIAPRLNSVIAESTRLAAENTDYDVGTLIQTSGATSPGDNFAATYLVVGAGEGDFPMINGNELLVIKGDEFLREQLIQNTAGDGSDLVAHTGTSDTVTAALDKRTIYVGSVAESFAGLEPSTGVLYRAIAWHGKSGAYAFADPTTRGGGDFVYDANRLKSEHDGVTVFSPTVPAVSAQAGANLEARTENYGTGSGETDPTGSGVFVRLSEKDHLTFHDAGVLESFTDCTARANAAILAAVNGPGKLYADEGTYNFTGAGSSADGMKLPSGALTQALEFYGAGIGKTILHQDSTARFLLSANTGSGEAGPDPDTDNSRNIKIHDMTLEGDVATAGFSEQFHLASLSAVSNLEIFRTAFQGYRGDGLYLGSSQAAATERHNVNVSIHDCIFDGVNKDNRNAVSIIDGTKVAVINNTFLNSTRSDMPGPVDIEPNGDLFARVVDITVAMNRFSNCGGQSGLIGFLIPNAYTLTQPIKGFWIHGNYQDDTNTAPNGFFFRAYDKDTGPTLVTSSVPEMDINSFGNVYNGNGVVRGVRGFQLRDKYPNGILVIADPSSSTEGNVLTGEAIGNKLFGVGNANGVLHVGSASDLKVNKNHFYNPTASGRAIAVFGSGVTTESDNLEILDNKFADNITIPLRVASHTLDAVSTIVGGNRFFGGSLIDVPAGFDGSKNPYDELSVTAVDIYDSTRLPDSFRIGETVALVNGDAGLPDTNEQGILRTLKLSGSASFRKFTTQWFYPANNTGDTVKEYWRKANSATNDWSGWVLVTATAV